MYKRGVGIRDRETALVRDVVGADGTGIFGKSFRRGGGFYIDVGCAPLISDGRVALRSGGGAEIAEVERRAVRLRSGEALPADLLVYATGAEE